MDRDRLSIIANRFSISVFQDEPIPRRQPPASLPAPLRAARELEKTAQRSWYARELLFIRQAELLANYVDDYAFSGQVVRYYPTYQSLTDEELRGYFAWRTRLRRGELEKTSLSFAFLYIYELLNQIGVKDPQEGYQKLCAFREAYGNLDRGIEGYLSRWLGDYVIFYGLDPALLADSPRIRYHQAVSTLERAGKLPQEQVLQALHTLGPKWLERSKFYRTHTADCDRVIHRVLGRMGKHYASCKRGFARQYFGSPGPYPVQLFESAVFYDCHRDQRRVYALAPGLVYTCRGGFWSVLGYTPGAKSGQSLNDLVKTIDAVMRQEYADPHPIRLENDAKWLLKIIREETRALLAEKKEAQARHVRFDYAKLSGIRRDAAITQDKLLVEEELEPEPEISEAPAPVWESTPAPPADTPLSAQEYRLLQCLLYGGSLDWVRQEGLLLSVLADGVNDKLYEEFADTVLCTSGEIAVVEDYIQELKGMVRP